MASLTPDLTMYNTGAPAQPNILQWAGQAASIQNALTENQLMQSRLPGVQAQSQEQQANLAQLQDNQKLTAYLSKKQSENPNTSPDPNDVGSWLATNAPLAYGSYQGWKDGRLALTDNGLNPITLAPQKVPLAGQQAQITQGAVPNAGVSGYQNVQTGTSKAQEANLAANQQYFNDKQTAADTAQKDQSAISNVYGLVKSGADTGTVVGAMKTWLAQHNIDVAGANTGAQMLQLVKDHAAQLQVNNGSRSDDDLYAKQLANINPNDLNGSLKSMLPYLWGNRQMAIDHAHFLRKQDPTGGTNPISIGEARSFLQDHNDPRVQELRFLQQNDPSALNARMKSLSQTDRGNLAKMDNELTIGNPSSNQ